VTTRPVDISVDDELRRKGATKKQTVVEGALEVADDPLHSREMGLLRVVHVKAHLLDRVGDVGPDHMLMVPVHQAPLATARGRRTTATAHTATTTIAAMATATIAAMTTATIATSTATAGGRRSARSTEGGGGLVSLLRPLVVVKAEAELEVALASSVSSSRRRLFCASQKDRNKLVCFRTVFKLSNFLFNPCRRFRTRVAEGIEEPREDDAVHPLPVGGGRRSGVDGDVVVESEAPQQRAPAALVP
jgi:hypothetical protein